MNEDPIANALEGLGLEVERREPSAIEQVVGSGLGGLGGQVIAKVFRMGWLGTGLGGVLGGALGLVAVTYRIRRNPIRPGATFDDDRVSEEPGPDCA